MMTIIIYISIMVMSQYLMSVFFVYMYVRPESTLKKGKRSNSSPLKMTVFVVVVDSVDTSVGKNGKGKLI